MNERDIEQIAEAVAQRVIAELDARRPRREQTRIAVAQSDEQTLKAMGLIKRKKSS